MNTIRLKDLPPGTGIAVKYPGKGPWPGAEGMMRFDSLLESELGVPVLRVERPGPEGAGQVRLRPGACVWVEVTSLDHSLQSLLNSYLMTGETIVVEALREQLMLSLPRSTPVFELAGLLGASGASNDVEGIPMHQKGIFSLLRPRIVHVRRAEISAIWIQVDVLEMWSIKELKRRDAIESRLKTRRQELFLTVYAALTDPELYYKGFLSLEGDSFIFEGDGFSMIFSLADIRRLDFFAAMSEEEIKSGSVPGQDELVLLEAPDGRTQVANGLTIESDRRLAHPYINGQLGRPIALSLGTVIHRLVR